MGVLGFLGGVHPPDNKGITNKKEIIKIEAKETLTFPLSQHLGAPASAVVEVGEKVLVGQCIASQSGFISAPIFSSVSGIVKKIDTCVIPNGNVVPCIIIESPIEKVIVVLNSKIKNIQATMAKTFTYTIFTKPRQVSIFFFTIKAQVSRDPTTDVRKHL